MVQTVFNRDAEAGADFARAERASLRAERSIVVAEQINTQLEGEAADVAMMALMSVVSAYVHTIAPKADRQRLVERLSADIVKTCKVLDERSAGLN